MSTRLRNFIVLLLTVFSIVSITKTAFSDNRYWVNGSGSWHDTNHWSEASGGKPGASVPTYADNVIFDNNSFTAQGQQVVIKGIAECNDFRWEVEDVKAGLKSKSFLIKSLTKSEIQVHGSILINDNISNKFFGDIVLKGDQNHEMFLNEKLNSNIIIDAPDGTYVLHSDIYTNKEFQLLQGNIETSNNSIECNGFISTGSQYRSLTIEGSRIVANYIDFENSENFIINEENSRFEIKKSISNKSVKAGNNSLSVYKAGSKASLSIEDIVTDSATCYNTLTGSITVSVSGGVKPYLYTLYTATPFAFVTSKSTPDTLYTFSGLAANNYVIRVQDNGFGLLQDGPYSVLQPNEFKANSITVNQGDRKSVV